MAPIRTGLIGTGARAHSYGSYISQNRDEFELAAVADIVPDKLNGYADEYRVPTAARYPSVEELLDRGPELDAIVITTNDASHEAVATSAFQARLPVLLEKPIATSAEGAYRVVHGADSRGLSLTIGLVLRYTPFYRKVKELVDGGAVGRMIQVEAKEVLHVHHTATSFMREHYRLPGGLRQLHPHQVLPRLRHIQLDRRRQAGARRLVRRTRLFPAPERRRPAML